MAGDEQDQSEALDDDKLAGDYPPERPVGALDYGTTPQEERFGEPLAERIQREEPDPLVAELEDRPLDTGADEVEVALLGEGDIDTEKDLIADPAEGDPDDAGDDDGLWVGPPPSGTAAGRAPGPAEEAAVHIVDER